MKKPVINSRPTPGPKASKKGSVTPLRNNPKTAASATELWQAAGLDLAKTTAELEQVSAINASRVVKLHDRISAGEYRIDCERIAEKMLALEAQLRD